MLEMLVEEGVPTEYLRTNQYTYHDYVRSPFIKWLLQKGVTLPTPE